MNQKLKNKIKRTFFYEIFIFFKERKEIQKWMKNGRPVPTPSIIKRKAIRQYAKKFNIKTLLETGTFQGKTVDALKDIFDKIYTIELDLLLYEKAKKKFLNFNYIKVVQGDSGKILGEILKNISEPCLFWLDGHYSAGITAKGKKNTPIIEELSHILNHKIKNHAILIDDARCFTGKDDYPTIKELKKIISNKNKKLHFVIKDDIIRIY